MSRSNWWIGGVLIVLGLMLLLNNLGVTNINIGEVLRTYWPLLLVLWGANILALRSRGGGSLLSGSILLILGLVFLGRNLGFLSFDMASFWRIIWPVIIILAGISLIKGPLSGGKNNIAFLGGVEKTKERWKLESGNYWAFMGGIDIIVPPNLTVICDGTAILGGVDFMGEGSGGIIGSCSYRHEGKNSSGAVVKIYSRAFMGGIDVKVKE